MEDSHVETLIQRFLDGELTRAERRELLRGLGSRPDVRERLVADEAMLEAAAALPRAIAPEAFVARVAAALPAQEPAAPSLAAPGRVRVSARAGLAAAACLLLALGFQAGRTTAPAAPPPEIAAAVPEKEVLVRLVLLEPRARAVTVVGDFNGWDPSRTPLAKAQGGVFHVTLPLKPGRYHYMYVVDGRQWRADPFAAETSLDGFGAQNSVLDVEL
jgi:anti-sigma factor RsiW